MIAFFSLLEKISNATLCLVIKDMEKLEIESLGYRILKY